MGLRTSIEWCDHTFNPWRGCTKVSAGCANCYADKLSKRNPKILGIFGDNGTRVVASEEMWKQPEKWNEAASLLPDSIVKPGSLPIEYLQIPRPRVFCASLADVFEDWKGPIRKHTGMVAHNCEHWGKSGEYVSVSLRIGRSVVTMDDVRRRLFALIDSTPHLDWLLVTKRPENIRKMWPAINGRAEIRNANGEIENGYGHRRRNVWLLTSVENQEQADKRIPELLHCRDLSPVLGLSCEPLLGPVCLTSEADIPATGDHPARSGYMVGPDDGKSVLGKTPAEALRRSGISWVIAGGESGPHARPMHPDWARSLRDQCQAAGVPYFHKQNGEYFTGYTVDGLPHFREFRSFEHWVAKAQTWVRGGTCMDAAGHVLRCGGDFMEARDKGLFPVTIMDRVGKKAAGRQLDGREWNQVPEVQSCR